MCYTLAIPRAKELCTDALMFQFPIPPSDVPLDLPGPVLRFFVCILLVIATVEMIVFNLPDK